MNDKKRTVDDIPRTIEKRDGWTVETLQPGRLVFCDGCGEDYTDSPATGGILFQSKAICPTCASKWEQGAKQYGEERFIKARCPVGMAFSDWVRKTMRGMI